MKLQKMHDYVFSTLQKNEECKRLLVLTKEFANVNQVINLPSPKSTGDSDHKNKPIVDLSSGEWRSIKEMGEDINNFMAHGVNSQGTIKSSIDSGTYSIEPF